MLFGYSPEEMYQIFKKYCKKIKYIDFRNIGKIIKGLIFKRKLIIDGLNSGTVINNLISDVCKQKGISNINQIEFPLIIPSVDLNNGTVYCFTSKDFRAVFSNKTKYIDDIPIGIAVQASCSYPGVFSPCNYQNINLIDGGIRENIPWRQVKLLGADKVLSIIFESEINESCCSNIIEVGDRAIQLICRELSNYEEQGSDYLLKILSKDISLLDFNKIDELYMLGYMTTKKEINKIKNILEIT